MSAIRRAFQILLLCTQEQVQYRARIWIWILIDLFHIALYPALWLQAYGDRATLGGFSREDLILYFVGAAFINIFANFALAYWMSTLIRTGRIMPLLLRPFSTRWWLILEEITHKLTRVILASPLLIIAIVFLAPRVDTSVFQILALVMSLILGIWLASLIQLVLGSIAFFIDRIDFLLWMFWSVSGVFSGRFAPIQLFPETLATIATILPFRFFIAVPLEALLGVTTVERWLLDMGILLVWILGFHVLLHVVWNRGLRTYQAFGT